MLPDAAVWREAASHHETLFAPLDPGAKIGLIARGAPMSMLVWEAGGDEIAVRYEPFAGYSGCGADMVLAADDEALAGLRAAEDARLFEVLRAGIRSGRIVCYMLRRRCDLEAKGYDEMLEALGFAFMGACR